MRLFTQQYIQRAIQTLMINRNPDSRLNKGVRVGCLQPQPEYPEAMEQTMCQAGPRPTYACFSPQARLGLAGLLLFLDLSISIFPALSRALDVASLFSWVLLPCVEDLCSLLSSDSGTLRDDPSPDCSQASPGFPQCSHFGPRAQTLQNILMCYPQ